MAEKLTQFELMDYMKKFFLNNDQLPPSAKIAKYFGVCTNAIFERLQRLEREGIIKKNSVGKYMFVRQPAYRLDKFEVRDGQ